jgi:Spy/CpxP family protein refolding chaperone
MKKGLIAIGILAGVVGLAACAHQQVANSAQMAAYRVMSEGDLSGIDKLAEFHKNLGITDAQKEQLKAIATKYHPAPEEMEARMANIKSTLLSDPFDAQKLRDAIKTHFTENESRLPKIAEGLTEARNVLTEAQRTKLAEMLAKKPPMPAHFNGFKKMILGRLASDLKLSDTQKTNLESIANQFHQDQSVMEKQHQALANFVRTGDIEPLKAAHQEMRDRIPTEELVSFASSLDLKQRQALVNHFEQMKNHGPHFPFRR